MLDGIKQLTPLPVEGVQGAAAVLIGLAAIQAALPGRLTSLTAAGPGR